MGDAFVLRLLGLCDRRLADLTVFLLGKQLGCHTYPPEYIILPLIIFLHLWHWFGLSIRPSFHLLTLSRGS